MKKRTRALDFKPAVRKKIIQRDGSCIFCMMGYHMEDVERKGQGPFSIMHYVPQAHGGLGIEQNGALGCQTHHDMLDNGHEGRRGEMLQMFSEYMISFYQEWDERNLIYDKWSFLKEGR